MNSLESVLAESVPWSDTTFPEATIESVTTHLKREWKELEESGFRDPSEFADVVLLMAHLAHKKFFRLEDAVRNKFEVNKKRKWGELDSEGVREHVRHEEEWKGPGHVEHFDPRHGPVNVLRDDTAPVNFMKLDPNGNPVGIGSTERTQVYGPVPNATYRAVVKEGMVTFQKMISYNTSGGEHGWQTIENIQSGSEPQVRILSKIQALVDMGCSMPLQVSAPIDLMGRLDEPVLNKRTETVIEMIKGSKSGRLGYVQRYRKGGKEYVSPPSWDVHLLNE